LKTSYGGGGWLKTSEYRHMVRRGSKIAQKTSYDIWTFPYWPVVLFFVVIFEVSPDYHSLVCFYSYLNYHIATAIFWKASCRNSNVERICPDSLYTKVAMPVPKCIS